MALIRDRYEGNTMARVMSFGMAILILIPMLAPAFDQVVLVVADLRLRIMAFRNFQWRSR